MSTIWLNEDEVPDDVLARVVQATNGQIKPAPNIRRPLVNALVKDDLTLRMAAAVVSLGKPSGNATRAAVHALWQLLDEDMVEMRTNDGSEVSYWKLVDWVTEWPAEEVDAYLDALSFHLTPAGLAYLQSLPVR